MTLVVAYEDDLVTLYEGDALEHLDVLADADVLLTDPPYGIAWKGIAYETWRGYEHTSKAPLHDGIANDADTTVRDAILAAWRDKRNRPAFVFGSLLKPPPRGDEAGTRLVERPLSRLHGHDRALAS